MRTVGFILLLLAAWCSPAWGDVVNIGWDDAPSRGGAQNLLFDCNTNTGSNTFVVTLVPLIDLLGVTDLTVSVRVSMGGDFVCSRWCYSTPLQPWWDLRPGAPRAGALTASADFQSEPWASSTTVEDPWGGSTTLTPYYRVDTSYHYSSEGVDSSQVGVQDIEVTPPYGTTVDLFANHEYYLVHLTLRNTRTVGVDAVPGCCASARLFAEVYLTNAGTQNGYVGGTREPLAWNGWRDTACPDVVPVRASTWGALKSRYH